MTTVLLASVPDGTSSTQTMMRFLNAIAPGTYSPAGTFGLGFRFGGGGAYANPSIFSSVHSFASGSSGFTNGTLDVSLYVFTDYGYVASPSTAACTLWIGGSDDNGQLTNGKIYEAAVFISTTGVVNRSVIECTMAASWKLQLSACALYCPSGTSCPFSYMNSTACPRGSLSVSPFSASCTPCPAGTYTSTTGSTSCTPCFAGTFTSLTGSTSCQRCPGGHYCPAGTSSWARLNCGRGNYCPDGSGAPTPCPYQVPPSGGWGALQVQGPAFLVETSHCLNHCFWNFTSGDGMLSKC